MRLRHLTKNIKGQNWLAVFLDFLIVVFGVFIGIQLGNWNELRQTRHAFADAQSRFADENYANIKAADNFLAGLEANLRHVENAIDILRSCESNDAGKVKLNTGINVIRGTAFLSIRQTALSALTNNDQFLSLMDEERREAIKEFERQVVQTQKTLDWLEQQPFKNHIENQSGVAFSALTEIPSLDGARIRILTMEKPMSEACLDAGLLNSFYLWERTATFQLLRARQIKARFEANLK